MSSLDEPRRILHSEAAIEDKKQSLEKHALDLLRDLSYFQTTTYHKETKRTLEQLITIESQIEKTTQVEYRDVEQAYRVVASLVAFTQTAQGQKVQREINNLLRNLITQEGLIKNIIAALHSSTSNPVAISKTVDCLRRHIEEALKVLQQEERELTT